MILNKNNNNNNQGVFLELLVAAKMRTLSQGLQKKITSCFLGQV